MTKIFLFNGPPRSGKDTAAKEMESVYEGQLVKFATPIKNAITALYFGNDREAFDQFDTSEMKDKPDRAFFGMTCRQVQIAISEQFMKTMHGRHVFGKILADEIKVRLFDNGGNDLFFVSDSGFGPEAEVLVEEFGKENVILIRIEREGFTFQGDSRSYINLDHLGVKTYTVVNPNGDKNLFFERMEHIVNANTTKEERGEF